MAAGKKWELFTSGDYVDLSAYGTDPANVMYAHTYFESYGTTNTYLWLGNTGGISAWVNGVNVFTKEHVSGYVYDRVPITLVPGLNKLLIKVSPANGQLGFSARVANADGNIINFKTYYNYLLRTANPATTFNVRGEWLTAFESEVTATSNTKGIYLRNSYDNGTGWYPALPVVTDASEPALTSLGAKTALFYKKSDGVNQQLRLRVTSDDGTTWGNEITITNKEASVYHLEALTVENTAYIFYSYEDGTLYYRTSRDMVDWSPEILVGQRIGIKKDSTRPYFAVTKLWSGKWALVWLDVSHRTVINCQG